ncbi:MAG: delta-60 repeat domain-containing protein, partial [Verrucomicrobiae bacterium]|nr:delta-60 repeat domain-containing protein [Verrucomicrobiae bacterium]
LGLAQLILAACVFVGRAQPPVHKVIVLEPDPDFRPLVATSQGVSLNVVLPQPGGKILVGGGFNSFGNTPANGLVRLDERGRMDESFKPWPGTRGIVFAAVALPGDRILVGGRFTDFGGEYRTALARLNPDGTVDPAFNVRIEGTTPEVRVIRPVRDGRLLIGGKFSAVAGVPRISVAQITPDGELDLNFDPREGPEDIFAVVHDLEIQSDGKVLVAGLFTKFAGQNFGGLVRLLPDGRIDTGFSTEVKWSQGIPHVQAVELDNAGRILIAGRFDSVNGILRRGVARLFPDAGELDLSFDLLDGVNDRGEPVVTTLRVKNTGQIIVAGRFDTVHNLQCHGLAMLKDSGLPDESLATCPEFAREDGSPAIINDLALLPDESVLVVGEFVRCAGQGCPGVIRFNRQWLVDPAFCPDPGRPLQVGSVSSIAVQADGGYVIGGSFEMVDGRPFAGLARFAPTGQLDPDFSSPLPRSGVVNAILCLEKGKLLIGGEFETLGAVPRVNLARLDPDGLVDTEFDPGSGPNGPVYALAAQPDGSTIVGGAFVVFNGHLRPGIARVDWNGEVDDSFAPVITYRNDAGEVYSLAIQPDGRVLVGGFFDAVDRNSAPGLVRLTPDGRLDPTFGRSLSISGKTVQILAIALQPDGKIIIAGAFDEINGVRLSGIARLENDGTLDSTFAPGAGIDGGEFPIIYSVQLYGQCSLLLAGEFSSYDTSPHSNIVQTYLDGRLLSQGQPGIPDLNTDALVNVLVAHHNGGVLMGGRFTRLGRYPRLGLARLKPTSSSVPALRITLEAEGPVLY